MKNSIFFFVAAASSSFVGCALPVESAGESPEMVDIAAVELAQAGENEPDGEAASPNDSVMSAPGSRENPFVFQTRLLTVNERQEHDTTLGRCSIMTLESELSASGLAPLIALETFTSCDRLPADRGAADSDSSLASLNVTQYAPAPSYTCARGQGLRSKWLGNGTIQTQYVSFERGGKFYVGYGSGIGLNMGSPFYWSMQLYSTDRIYAATMRTSGSLSGAGTCCFNPGGSCSI